jgi:uncharacterized protein (TIGR03000 family)
MYGVIVAAMLTTTAPAAPDWCGAFPGFGCGPYAYAGWCGCPGWCGYPGWCGWYGYFGPWYGWPVVYSPVVVYGTPAPAANPEPGPREKALEDEIRALKQEIRKLQGVKPKEETAAPAPANVVVKLPADARLFVDDDPCPLTSAERSFKTPELQPGVTYHYTIRAEVTRDGRAVKESKRVTVRAGEETVVQFGEMSPVAAASR